jgi:leader peptidase (prepilin peptidase)/N-methyltransferase
MVNKKMSLSMLPYLVFFIGLVWGSFFNVCIHRIPRGESILFPYSHCPYCGNRIKARDLVPLLNYLWLKARCRYCGSSISPLQPVIELLTGLIFTAAYLRFGLSAMLIKALFLISVLLVISCIDLKHYIIPDKIIIFSLSGGAVLVILFHDPAIVSALAGSVSSALFLLALALISHGGMGGGDIKLAAVIGLCLGWPSGLFAVILGCLLAGLSGLALVLTRVKSRKDAIPFAPFLSAGTLLMLHSGSDIMYWYFCNALFI